jgi:monofunctional biosynthetic peptidoglycan transglycosylase
MKREMFSRPFFHAGRTLFRLVLVFIFLSLAFVLALRWVTPPFSSFMVQKKFARYMAHTPYRYIYSWVDIKKISPNMAMAGIAAEDQRFAEHSGFDVRSISRALKRNRRTRHVHGASTISQQVAKNLFLWPGRSYLRKTLEAYFTVCIELMWPKRRILEVYLNIAEFGNGIYGVREASRIFFNKSPALLTRDEAALLAAVLPNPHRFKVEYPSNYIDERREWIKSQMKKMGRCPL